MADNSEKTYVNREHRFCVSELEGLDVIISRAAEISTPEFNAELVDFSCKGLKLKVPISLCFEESINVRLVFDETDIWYDGIASVRHIRAHGDQSWMIGCAVEPRIREEIVAKLANSSGKERRRHPRFDVVGAGTLQCQGDTCKGYATIKNVSEGGFCAEEAIKHEIGDVVKLDIEDENLQLHQIAACVRWQRESEQGYVTGFSFVDTDGFEKLMSCVSKSIQDEDKANPEKMSLFVILAALLTMVLPPALSIIMQSDASATLSENSVAAIDAVVDPRVLPNSDAPETEVRTIGNAKGGHPFEFAPTEKGYVARRKVHQANTNQATHISRHLTTSPEFRGHLIQPQSDPSQAIEAINTGSNPVVNKTDAIQPVEKSVHSPEENLVTAVVDPADPEDVDAVTELPENVIQFASEMEDGFSIDNSRKSKMREWVDSSGTYRVMAELKEVADKFIKIRKENGEVVSVPLERLSSEDLRFVILQKMKSR